MLRYFKKLKTKIEGILIESEENITVTSKDVGTTSPGDIGIEEIIAPSNVIVDTPVEVIEPKVNMDASKDADIPIKSLEFDVKSLQADPGLRCKISSFHPNVQDEVRRAYLLNGPCQPRGHSFPFTDFSGRNRRFISSWLDEYRWLEYSIEKDAAYCLYCYLFRNDGSRKAGGDSFIGEGFKAWNKKDRFETHVGDTTSAHNVAYRKCDALMRQALSIQSALFKQTNQMKNDYRIRLEATLKCIRYLIRGGDPLRGHDESEDSKYKGKFLETLDFYIDGKEEVAKVVLKNAQKNLKMTSPDIQKDLVHAAAAETTNAIIRDIGDDFFCTLVDEARDVSIKEQMAVVLRYVTKDRFVIERFLGLSHVAETKSLTLKVEIESMLIKHGLSMSKIRGQGYDGASNMRGEINGLKTLILAENSSAYYVHCFAHQLQLTLVAVAKNHSDVGSFFTNVAALVNLVGGSCKRMDTIRACQAEKIAEALSVGEIESGKGLNQETNLRKAGDTRWGSHFGSLVNLEKFYSSAIDVLEVIRSGGISDARSDAVNMFVLVQSFDFAFIMKMMIRVLSITNELSIALQKRDQDIVNAMNLVCVAKHRLQAMRDNGWESLLADVESFCLKECLPVLKMDEQYAPLGRSRRNVPRMTNLHHFQVELFYAVLDMQLQELNSHFDEVNSELICCMTCLSPESSFAAFNKERLVKLATFYP